MNQPAATLCQCGSGLRPARCCALDPASIPSAESTRHLVPLVERAIQAHRNGDLATAESLSLDVLQLEIGRAHV